MLIFSQQQTYHLFLHLLNITLRNRFHVNSVIYLFSIAAVGQINLTCFYFSRAWASEGLRGQLWRWWRSQVYKTKTSSFSLLRHWWLLTSHQTLQLGSAFWWEEILFGQNSLLPSFALLGWQDPLFAWSTLDCGYIQLLDGDSSVKICLSRKMRWLIVSWNFH